MRNFLGVFIVPLCLSISSCGMIMNRYSSFPQNVSLLREVGANTKDKIKVEEFTATYDAKTSKSCRMVGPINMPDKESASQVIRKALIDELTLSNLFAENGTKTINAHINNISLNTINPKWVIDGIFDLEGKKIPVVTEHKFEGGFVAVTACNNAVNAFMPTVQDFLNALFKTDEFKQFLLTEKQNK